MLLNGAKKGKLDGYTTRVVWWIDPLLTLGNGLEVKPSTLDGAGNGLFFTRAMRKGTIITSYAGIVIRRRMFGPGGDTTGASSHYIAVQRGMDEVRCMVPCCYVVGY